VAISTRWNGITVRSAGLPDLLRDGGQDEDHRQRKWDDKQNPQVPALELEVHEEHRHQQRLPDREREQQQQFQVP
jgi:hypothetical protein